MSVIPIVEENKLKAKIAKGDEGAFTLVYNTYYPIIYGFARHLLHSDELAIDVVQESMLHIWQLGGKLEAVNNLEAYCKMFARRRAVDLLRRRIVAQRAEQFLGDIWTEEDNRTEEGILLEEGRRILRDGVELLPQQQRKVYEFCQQDGLKYEEAAERLGISTGTVKTHLKLAMKFLRAHIKNRTDVAALLIIFKLF